MILTFQDEWKRSNVGWELSTTTLASYCQVIVVVFIIIHAQHDCPPLNPPLPPPPPPAPNSASATLPKLLTSASTKSKIKFQNIQEKKGLVL